MDYAYPSFPVNLQIVILNLQCKKWYIPLFSNKSRSQLSEGGRAQIVGEQLAVGELSDGVSKQVQGLQPELSHAAGQLSDLVSLGRQDVQSGQASCHQ